MHSTSSGCMIHNSRHDLESQHSEQQQNNTDDLDSNTETLAQRRLQNRLKMNTQKKSRLDGTRGLEVCSDKRRSSPLDSQSRNSNLYISNVFEYNTSPILSGSAISENRGLLFSSMRVSTENKGHYDGLEEPYSPTTTNLEKRTIMEKHLTKLEPSENTLKWSNKVPPSHRKRGQQVRWENPNVDELDYNARLDVKNDFKQVQAHIKSNKSRAHRASKSLDIGGGDRAVINFGFNTVQDRPIHSLEDIKHPLDLSIRSHSSEHMMSLPNIEVASDTQSSRESQNEIHTELQPITDRNRQEGARSLEQNQQETLQETPQQRQQQQEAHLSPEILLSLQAELYVNQAFALSLAMFMCYLYLMLEVQKISSLGIFGIMSFYLLFLAYTNFACMNIPQSSRWKKQRYLFDGFDAISGVIFFILISLRLYQIIPISYVASVPFGCFACFYYCFSRAPIRRARPAILFKCYLTFQALLITLRIDNIIDWEWIIISLVSFPQMISLCLQMLLLFATLLVMIFFAVTERTMRLGTFIDNLTGHLWHCLVFGLKLIAFIAIVVFSRPIDGYTQAYGANYICIRVGCYTSAFFMLITIIKRKVIVRNMYQFFYTTSREDLFTGVNLQQNQDYVIHVNVERKPSYFVRLTSTYFGALSNNLIAKNQEQLEAIKKRIANKFSLRSNRRAQSTNTTTIRIEDLQAYKDRFDEESPKLKTMKNLNLKCTKRAFSLAKLDSTPDSKPKSIDNVESAGIRKECLSVGDVSEVKDDGVYGGGKLDGDERLCYICCSNVANAILMNCNHGGICYECALHRIKEKDECMECRKKVDAIYKIETDYKLHHIIKGTELTTIDRRYIPGNFARS